MLKPPNPPDEPSRIASLRDMSILDTSPEDRFDRITRMAIRLFGVDSCLISLVDEQRQWFKSRQGIDATETPRDVSFCGHTILEDRVFIVEDATKDERFADNPLVTGEPNLRFYAGVPVHSPAGYRVGALCLVDSVAHVVTEENIEILKDLGALVDLELRQEQSNTVDEQTMLANRTGFVALANQSLSLHKRMNIGAELIAFDLQEPETAHSLKQFANALKLCFREADIIARIEGTRFAVLMTNSYGNSQISLDRLNEITGATRWYAAAAQYLPDVHDSVERLLEDAGIKLEGNLVTRQQL